MPSLTWTLLRRLKPVPDTALPAFCVVGAATWTTETLVPQVQCWHPDPCNSPTNCVSFPDPTRSQGLQWAHASNVSCHAVNLQYSLFCPTPPEVFTPLWLLFHTPTSGGCTEGAALLRPFAWNQCLMDHHSNPAPDHQPGLWTSVGGNMVKEHFWVPHGHFLDTSPLREFYRRLLEKSGWGIGGTCHSSHNACYVCSISLPPSLYPCKWEGHFHLILLAGWLLTPTTHSPI